MWNTSCPDWEKRLLAGESLVPPDLPLYRDEAAAALKCFKEELRIVDAAGSPTMGEACRPWVFDFVEAVFGSYDRGAGRQLIRDFLLLVSKKNSKSTLAAGIMLTALLRNWRLSAEYLIVAPTIEIAKNSFDPAYDMIRANDELSALLHAQPTHRTITHRKTRALLKVVAADNESISGKKSSGVLIDELWLFGKRANAENMLREATGGLASRPEGFVISLSTQSDEPPTGVFKQRLDYFRGVRDGKIDDPQSLGVLYEFPPKMLAEKKDRLREYFYVTNPNLGASVDAEFLNHEHKKAEQAGEGSLRGFYAKHLNVEIGFSLRDSRWAGADFWEAAVDRTLTLETLIQRCDVAAVGGDLGGLYDLSALDVIGRERGTRRWLSWTKAWCHISLLAKQKAEAARLIDFAKAGELVIIDAFGPMDPETVTIEGAEASMQGAEMEAGADPFEINRAPPDIEGIVEIISRIDKAGILAAVGLDPYGIGALVDALAEIGIGDSEEEGGDAPKRIIGISQGWKLTGAIKTVERKLADGTFRHADQALMSWAVGNAKVEPRGNAFLISKQASGSAKIDPLMALFDAATIMAGNPEPPNPESIYNSVEKRPAGFLVV